MLRPLFLLVLLTRPCGAQSPFTVDDALAVNNIGSTELSADGRWLAVTYGSLRDRLGADNHRFGDPTYIAPALSETLIIDTQSGASRKLFPDKRQVRGFAWSPDAARLAFLLRSGDVFEPWTWERSTGKMTAVRLPDGREAVDNAELEWLPDGRGLLFALRSREWRAKQRKQFLLETEGPIVVHSSKEPFLAWDDLRRSGLSRSLAVWDPATGQTRELVAETRLSAHHLSEDGGFLRLHRDITKKTDYDVIFGGESEILAQPIGGESRIILKSTKGINPVWSRDGRSYAYAKDGKLYFASIDDKEPKLLAGSKDKPDTDKPPLSDEEKERQSKERFSPVRLSPKGDRLVASNKEGLWLFETGSAAHELFIKTPEDDKLAPRYQVVDWSPDGSSIYLSYAARPAWERGLVRYRIANKGLEDVIKDSRLYQGWEFSKDGGTVVVRASEGNRPADVYVFDAKGGPAKRLTTLNPWLKERRLGKTELVRYLDADGKTEHGVLYYPADYAPGAKYPTVFIVYEQFFDDVFNATTNILTANGYAVMTPSVEFETGFPGEAWAKGVTAAANRLIEMGVADPERLGVQGTSYGGYATNLLITQTNRFKAAINISGKVDMISFYTDSPRLGVRNIHAPEKSQDRLGATLWQQPQKYVQHSAIMFADRIKTPLLLITGEQDHNVPARQAMEMYYALRRLGKEVAWVSYVNGGHGMPAGNESEVRDFHQRILSWYEEHLKKDKQDKKPEKAPSAP